MPISFSLYLDLVRFLAAVLVYVYHSNQRWLVADVLPFSSYGHSAVVVFFVLSGYVIAQVTATKESDWRAYAASRLARVYSVVLPALALTLMLDAVGRTLSPTIYAGYPFDNLSLRLAVSMLMLNELWGMSVTCLSNVPYWSITFESWYYLMYGLWCFAPSRWRLPLLSAALLAAGPKILLLAPLWILGVTLVRRVPVQSMPTWLAWAGLAFSWFAIVWVHRAGVLQALHEWTHAAVGQELDREMTFSKYVLGDYVLALLVAMNFVCFRQLAPAFDALLAPIQRPLRWIASYTFTLYLLHQPLFMFWGALLRMDPSGLGQWGVVTALVGISVVALGAVTERQRYRLRGQVSRFLGRWPAISGRA
jgi:peptidoglycan/LPS O-acetylase OafA/YrhL